MATPVVVRITVRTTDEITGLRTVLRKTEVCSNLHVFHDGTLATVCLNGEPNGRMYRPEDILSFDLFYSA